MSYTVKLLGEICEISTGSTDTKDATENGQYPLFDRSKKVKASDKYLFDCEALIMPGEGAEFLPRHYIGKFDLHQRAYAMFNFSEIVNPQYLYFYLISVKDYFANNAVGATVKSLRRRHFTDLKIPLPSLEKQREIVEKLDSAFAEIDLLEENLGLGNEKVNQLQQSLLSTSFMATNVLQETSNPSANQEFAMKKVKLSEVCAFSRGLTYSKSDEVDYSSNVVLRANNIDLASNSLNLEDLRYIKDSIKIKKEKIAKKNSLIICTASGSKSHVGKVALIDEDYGYAFGGFMGQLTPSEECHPKFLYYVLTSGLFKEFLMSLNDGSNINNLKFSDIEDYEVRLPTLEKQGEIVDKLDMAFAEIELLRTQIKVEKDQASALRQSLLNNAFSQIEVAV
jgi:type I restriction enzyme S subunit